jgi:hypothetical protein
VSRARSAVWRVLQLAVFASVMLAAIHRGWLGTKEGESGFWVLIVVSAAIVAAFAVTRALTMIVDWWRRRAAS